MTGLTHVFSAGAFASRRSIASSASASACALGLTLKISNHAKSFHMLNRSINRPRQDLQQLRVSCTGL
jgi:hypothetical protein